MYNEIIELLPSSSLKRKLIELKYKFSEKELIYIIYEFAKTFDQRQALLRKFAENALPESAKSALLLADWQDEIYRDFCENSEGYVYELRIWEPEYAEERFLCSSYAAALKYIDLYYEEYEDIGVKKTEKSRYHIVKRRLYNGADDEGFCEDGVAECILGEEKNVISIHDTRPMCNKFDNTENICGNCEMVCPCKSDEILFPCFINNGDIIKYTQLVYTGNDFQENFYSRHTELHYGIAITENSEPTDYIYTLPLDSDAMREHKYDEYSILQSHDHIYAPYAEVISIDELDEKMKEDYLAYMEKNS